MNDQSSHDQQKSPQSWRVVNEEENRLLKAHQDRIIQQSADGPTEKLSRDGLTPLPGSVPAPLIFGNSSAETYLRLPLSIDRHHPDRIRWRIELHGLPGNPRPLGLDILGDVIIGRGTDRSKMPDLDLDLYGALHGGVSRHHAILKPTPQSLYLLDLNSTNGTQYNGMPVTSGLARSLLTNDVIALGSIRFQVRVVESPSMRR